MSSLLIYKDELQGFLRSKVMIILAVGLPVLVVVLRLLRPDTEGVPFFSFTAILIASIGGTLGSVLLSTGITNERQQHVYDLFLIRPVRRSSPTSPPARPTVDIETSAVQPVVLSLSGTAIACSAGVSLGVLIESMAASAILTLYPGNQLAALAAGGVVPGILLAVAVAVFRRQTL